jgi:hypothetical chaperone protein
MLAVGLDFGTTNSALCAIGAGGGVVLARFDDAGASVDTFRSILFFNPEVRDERNQIVPFAGPRAIREYLEAAAEGRLVQSVKSFLADRSFHSTFIFDRDYRLEDLVGLILKPMREQADGALGALGDRAVVGRPVRFSAAQSERDEQLAEERLKVALRRAGFTDIVFEFEPVAAAWHHGSRIDRDELVLIGDFGGGTSDFSLLRITPRIRGQTRHEILGSDGVAIAGDAFDREILRHLVVPELGRGSKYRSPYGQVLPMPTPIYFSFERWHQLSFMKTPAMMTKLRELRAAALEPQKLDALTHIVENDLGYMLFRAVERTKTELSSAAESAFVFRDGPIAIEKRATRDEFEHWIAPELKSLAECVDRLFERTSIAQSRVDRVFLTGGSSFVPAVRRIFEERFGAERIVTGDEFTSVARGLALRARDLACGDAAY